MASNSQLKYGARLINSYLGNNATISCCEVLNSLIFPAHEQHHNNSFLCAALIMGQSNIAAGATIGSNHNSRSADGEMIAGRGFWPGLCVSLKHNSKFASFTILAKGDYPAELNVTIPFALVSQDVSKDLIQVMPAYWFMYNMYGLARNSWKYIDRDKRPDKLQQIEYDFLAPDTINEIFEALAKLEFAVGNAYCRNQDTDIDTDIEIRAIGKKLLADDHKIVNSLEVLLDGFENSDRKVVVLKTVKAYSIFRELVLYYGINALVQLLEQFGSLSKLQEVLPERNSRATWQNVGGQLVPGFDVKNLLEKINTGRINSWDEIHAWYAMEGSVYSGKKQLHAMAALKEISGTDIKTAGADRIKQLLKKALSTKTWMLEGIKKSREKDYDNPFRKMVYESPEEMDKVLGSLADNSFIQQEERALEVFKKRIASLSKKLSPKKLGIEKSVNHS